MLQHRSFSHLSCGTFLAASLAATVLYAQNRTWIAPLVSVSTTAQAGQPARNKAAGNKAALVPPRTVFKPKVVLSAEHQKMCRVGVGDKMPGIQLPDLTGKTRTLAEAAGTKLTVVVFWNADHRYAVDEFRHLETDVVARFGSAGVSAVAVHVGRPADKSKYEQLCKKYGEKLVCLLDADRQAFARVATEKLPRTYLLDAEGKILWLDIEYSRTTRFDLDNAIRYYLQEQPAAAKKK